MAQQNQPKKYQYSAESLDKIIFVGGGQSPLKGVSGAEACAAMGYHGQLQHIMKVQLAEAKHDLTIKKKVQRELQSPAVAQSIEETKKKIQYAKEIIGECDRAALYEMFSRHCKTDEEIWERVNNTIKVHYQDREKEGLEQKSKVKDGAVQNNQMSDERTKDWGGIWENINTANR